MPPAFPPLFNNTSVDIDAFSPLSARSPGPSCRYIGWRSMSQRIVRESTKLLRNAYPTLSPRHRPDKVHRRTHTRARLEMSVPAVTIPPDPATGDGLQPGGQPGTQPAGGEHTPGGGDGVPATDPPGADVTNYAQRLKALEDKMERAQATRQAPAATPATPKADSTRTAAELPSTRRRNDERPRSPSRHRARPYTSQSRDRYTLSRSRRYSPRHSRSRGHTRSSSRRRSRSRSHHRRRRSRSRSRASSRSSRLRRSRSTPLRRRTRSPRSPRDLRRDAATSREASRAIDAQYPNMGTSTGRPLPQRRATLEPY